MSRGSKIVFGILGAALSLFFIFGTVLSLTYGTLRWYIYLMLVFLIAITIYLTYKSIKGSAPAMIVLFILVIAALIILLV